MRAGQRSHGLWLVTCDIRTAVAPLAPSPYAQRPARLTARVEMTSVSRNRAVAVSGHRSHVVLRTTAKNMVQTTLFEAQLVNA